MYQIRNGYEVCKSDFEIEWNITNIVTIASNIGTFYSTYITYVLGVRQIYRTIYSYSNLRHGQMGPG